VLCGPSDRDLARQDRRCGRQTGVHSLADFPLSVGLTRRASDAAISLLPPTAGRRHFGTAFESAVLTLFGPTHIAWDGDVSSPLRPHAEESPVRPVPASCLPARSSVYEAAVGVRRFHHGHAMLDHANQGHAAGGVLMTIAWLLLLLSVAAGVGAWFRALTQPGCASILSTRLS